MRPYIKDGWHVVDTQDLNGNPVVKKLKPVQRKTQRLPTASKPVQIDIEANGPGAYFKKIVKLPQCVNCTKLQREMDEKGVGWCEKNFDSLLERLVQHAKDKKWDKSVKQRVLKVLSQKKTGRAGIKLLLLHTIQHVKNQWNSDVTICVTAFKRPRHLKQLLDSIKSHYPLAKVLVADNGDEPISYPGVDYTQLPFDCGLSASRNYLVKQVTTPYFLLLEEDFVVDERCRVDKMLDILTSRPDIGVVGGMHEASYRGPARGQPFVLNGIELIDPGKKTQHKTKQGSKFNVAEFVSNFALFRTEMARQNPWNEQLKIGEHSEFYLNVKRDGNWIVAFTQESQIGHDKEQIPTYSKYRKRAEELQLSVLAKRVGDQPPLIEQPSRCILILTPGRSGSSLLSGILHKLGVHMYFQPVTHPKGNPTGFHEDLAFQRMVEEGRLTQANIQEYINIRSTTRPLWGLKAPGLLNKLDVAFACKWPSPRVFITERSKTNIDASLNRVGWGGSWFNKTYSQMAKAHTCPWPKMVVNYNNLIEAPRETLDGIIEHAQIQPTAVQIQETLDFIDPNLRHFK